MQKAADIQDAISEGVSLCRVALPEFFAVSVAAVCDRAACLLVVACYRSIDNLTHGGASTLGGSQPAPALGFVSTCFLQKEPALPRSPHRCLRARVA